MTGRELSQGDVLAGKYRLVSPLGRGGMGTVWRAEHLTLRSPLAIKLVAGRAAESQEALGRFLREAQAAAALRSPHVVQIIDYGVEGSTPFIAMELLEGESLADRLRRVGRLSPEETSRVVTHVARAIARAHEAGVVHRDLKPDNVFLVANADDEIAKVLDFGIAKVDDTTSQATTPATRTGAVMGTPHYMSPEQARGNRAVDHRSDLWSLGVIAYECLTGRRPFESDVLGDLLIKICAEEAPVPSSVVPVPAGFDAWFARATARDPNQRFQSAQEMSEALRGVLGQPTLQTWSQAPVASVSPVASTSLPPVVAPKPRRSAVPLLVAVVGAFGVLFAVVAAVGLWLWSQSEAEPEAQVPVAASSAPVEAEAPSAPPSQAAPAAAQNAHGTAPKATATTTASGAVPESAQKQIEDAQKQVEAAQKSADKARSQAEAAKKSAEALKALGK
ncbi:MAG: serine/threonine protein kinase [Myxococcales bacterium]|nr:serine/threonine protein kinase [Myxococcales bacterium]MCB9578491.1 serine/threonine protein kinase [Polyangiaceae bacterium]